MPAPLTSFEQFVTFLTENNVPHKLNKEAQLVEMPSPATALPGGLYVRWERTVPFIQIIQFMIDGVPTDRVRELEAALARLNNKLEVGGFGLDHENGRLYCRMTVPVIPPDGINPMLIDHLARGIVRNAQEFVEAFAEVVAGKPGDQIVPIYEAIATQRTPPADA